MTKKKRKTEILKLARKHRTLTPRLVAEIGYAARDLWELAEAGHIDRVGRGRYRHPKAHIDPYADLHDVAEQVENAIFCLLTALHLHQLGTQLPPSVWLLVPTRSRIPRVDGVPIEAVQREIEPLLPGIMERKVQGRLFRVTSPAQTVADCFRFRNRVGTDVAIEALKEGLKKRAFTSDELYHACMRNRVWSVVRPYAEALE